ISESDKNCGGCGRACTGSQFCLASACQALLLSAMCVNDSVLVVDDGDVDDEAAAAVAGPALQAGCAKAIALDTQPQADPKILDQGNGQPLVGPGRTVLLVGGSYFQHGLAYLDRIGRTNVAGRESGASYTLQDRASGRVLVQTDESALSVHHD